MISGMNARITVSIPSDLLRRVERLGKQRRTPSRSALVVQALESFVARMQAEEVDAQLDAYYGTRTSGEKAEEARMVRAIRRSQRRIKVDEEE